jgi:hypothetical protein
MVFAQGLMVEPAISGSVSQAWSRDLKFSISRISTRAQAGAERIRQRRNPPFRRQVDGGLRCR